MNHQTHHFERFQSTDSGDFCDTCHFPWPCRPYLIGENATLTARLERAEGLRASLADVTAIIATRRLYGSMTLEPEEDQWVLNAMKVLEDVADQQEDE